MGWYNQQPKKNGPSTKVTLHANFTAPPMAPLQNFKCRTLHEAAQVGRMWWCGLWWMTTFQKDEKVIEVEFLEIYFYPKKTIG